MIIPKDTFESRSNAAIGFVARNCVLNQRQYLYLVVLFIAVVLQYYSRGNSLFVTQDSLHYLAGSKNALSSFTYVDTEGHHFLYWPPLFAVVIALFNSSSIMSIVHMIVTAAIGFFTYQIIQVTLKNKILRFQAFIFIILSVHILLISNFLWSELIFLLIELIFVYHVLKIDYSKKHLLLAILFGIIMCLQRNAGVFIVAGATVWIWLAHHKKINPLVFFTLSVSGAFLWNIYVWFFVPHEHFNFDVELFQFFTLNTNSLSQALINIFLPFEFLPNLMLPVCVILYYFYMKKELMYDREFLLFSLLPTVYLLFLYIILIINIAGFQVHIGEADRFISVIIPFMGILFFRLIEKTYEKRKVKWILLVAMLSLVYPITRAVKNSIAWHKKSVASEEILWNSHN